MQELRALNAIPFRAVFKAGLVRFDSILRAQLLTGIRVVTHLEDFIEFLHVSSNLMIENSGNGDREIFAAIDFADDGNSTYTKAQMKVRLVQVLTSESV